MKTNYHVVASLALAACLSLSGCQEESLMKEKPQTETSSTSDVEALRLEFSKALAQSMEEKQVRAFLKTEALKEFDGDYDVMYSFVKDKALESGKTFEQVLLKYTTVSNFGKVSDELPLLTIYVPTLSDFSAETWNLDSQIPKVAIDKSHLGKSTILATFSSDLTQTNIDAAIAPSFPTIVVKENERIISKSKREKVARKDLTIFEEKSVKIIKENSSHNFYFIGDVDPKLTKGSNSRTTANRPVHESLQFYQFHKSGRPNEPGTQRDWLYYRIWPKFNELELVAPNINGGVDIDWSKGTLGGTYFTERLTKFKFNSAQGIGNVSETWTEGTLEFHVVLTFMHRNGGMTNDLKVFYCSPNQLKDANNNPVEYDPDVELMLWDVNRYGDEWKLTVLEHDNGGSISQTISSKSTFGSNFEANASWDFVVKLGVKYNGTSTFENNASTTITVSQESDQLGDVRFTYDNPILTQYGGDTRYTMGTGALTIAIEPISKTFDNRLYPYID